MRGTPHRSHVHKGKSAHQFRRNVGHTHRKNIAPPNEGWVSDVRCVHLRAVRNPKGMTILKKGAPWSNSEIPLPCGRCINCKLERTRQWAVRLMAEAQMHDENYFVTFTYEINPRTLTPEDIQKFFKRLRKHQTIRYFQCGEYGTGNDRPHHHAIIYGLHINDLVVHATNRGNTLYTSSFLTKLWGHGHVVIGRVTFETASYVASYCTKKITGDKATDHYERLDKETGELYSIKPEYATMSLKPAIASSWLTKYGASDVFPYDHVIVSGREQKPPRYYDKFLATLDAEKLFTNKLNRQTKAKLTNQKENTKQRLQAQEIYSKAKYSQRKNTL